MAKIGDIIKGLQIVQKYTGPEAYSVDAQHDVIHAYPVNSQ